MAKDITFELEANNLGPHRSLKFKDTISSLELGVFGTNGMGKTFLSRAFRIVSSHDLKIDHANKLLTLGQSQGFFKVKINNSKETNRTRDLAVTLTRNALPLVVNNTDYTFHVFNRDYVKENLEELKYRPSGKIEGYILGKEKIDLTKERDELSKASKVLETAKAKLNKAIVDAQRDLSDLSIRKNTSEYQAISYSNVVDVSKPTDETEDFTSLKTKLSKLDGIPADLESIENVINPIGSSLLDDIKSFLTTSFSRSTLSEEFKNKVRGKQQFIEDGVELLGSELKECPFCEQELLEKSLSLIDLYNQYLNDAEATQIRRAKSLIDQLDQIWQAINSRFSNYLKAKVQFDKYKSYLPSLSALEFSEIIDPKELSTSVDALKDKLSLKREDISKAFGPDEFDEFSKSISAWIDNSSVIFSTNQQIVKKANEARENINSERLSLNRRLCKAKYNSLLTQNSDLITEIQQEQKEIIKLEENIRIKEHSQKISKRDKVAEAFETLVSTFFGDKYKFDVKDFCLKFLNHSLSENASDVLSDGEKSIIAFCYYLAETHKLIADQDDYKKLFFVIDDPISSLDFHYVYSIAQSIRTLNKKFELGRLRFLILTHNLEFMSILIRNNVVTNRYFLTEGTIVELKRDLIMPYEEHLRDIYEISRGTQQPCHTTGNSVRHILETINRFSSPDKDLAKFCEEVEGFGESEFLYSLMHDSSHGGIRVNQAYTVEMVKRGCEIVVEYIRKFYSGQIAQLEKVN